jgi:hypothetical protein
MIIPSIYADDHGHSLFGQVDLQLAGTPRRQSARNQDILYWQMAMHQPGHHVDFAPASAATMLCVMSGQLDLTTSNGDIRHFARGEMVFLQDIKGQGHITRVTSIDPCVTLMIAMPGAGTLK